MAIADSAAWHATLEAMGNAPGKQRCRDALTPGAGPVCVTGASGFIALHLVKQLLEKGYTVVATVRSTRDARKMQPLMDLQIKFGSDKLRIVGGVDCMKRDTFVPAVDGCVGVFHTASPFHFNSQDPLNDLVLPAEQGTLGCLEACLKVGTVKRVIITSSFAAMFNPGGYPWEYTYSSKDWNKMSQPDDQGKFPEPVPAHGYRYSKIVAEKAAWDFAASPDCPFDVAAVNPPMVVGHNHNRPQSADDLNTSSAQVMSILMGQKAAMPNSIGWVDAADVARAHITTYEKPEAGGRRFLCAADEVPTWTEIAKLLKELCPGAPVNTSAPASGEGVRMTMDTSDLKNLGFIFTPLRDTLKAQCDSLLTQGFAKL